MTVKRVVIIRNGETDWNRQGRWQGWVEAPLNAHGRQQAAKLAKFVRHIAMSALYSSDLRRARDTAELIAEQCGFEPIYDARLRERNIGDWQGLTQEEVESWYAAAYGAFVADPQNAPVPGGETRGEVCQRMRAAFDDILAAEQGETVGIVSHTTAVKTLLTDLLPESDERSIDLDNSSVTTIVRDGDGAPWRLVTVGDSTHLEGLETQSVSELEYRR